MTLFKIIAKLEDEEYTIVCDDRCAQSVAFLLSQSELVLQYKVETRLNIRNYPKQVEKLNYKLLDLLDEF